MKQQLTPEESSQFDILYYEHRKDPTLTIVLSILTGYFAVDRFYLQDYTLGILKLILMLTIIGGFIFYIYDICTSAGRTKTFNRKKADESLRAIKLMRNSFHQHK